MATRGREGEEDVEDVALLRNGGESRHAKPRNKYFVILPFEMYAVLSSHTNLSLQYNITLVLGVFVVRQFLAKDASEASVGEMAGFLAGAAPFGALLTSYGWGLVSDQIGRKTVIICSSIAVVSSLCLMVLAPSYPLAVLARFLGGLCNGAVGSVKSVIGEVGDEAQQATGIAYMSLVWGIGSIFGPLIAGTFSRPCDRLSSSFSLCAGATSSDSEGGDPVVVPPLVPDPQGGSGLRRLLLGDASHAPGLLVRHPYLLPALLVAVSTVLTAMLVARMRETAPGVIQRRRAKARREREAWVRRQAAAGEGGSGHRKWGEVEMKGLIGARDGATMRPLPASAVLGLGGKQGEVLEMVLEEPDELMGAAVDGDSETQVLRSGVALTPQSAAAAQRRVSMGDRWVDPSDPGYRPASGSASASTSPLARGGRDEESRGSFAGGRHEGHSDLDGPWAEDKAPRPQAFLPWYRDRGCIMAVTGYGLVAIVYCLIDELVPVFASTEPSRGGLGLTERDFSVPLGVGGAVLILYTLVVAPVIVAKVGHGPSVVYSLVLQAPMALLIPATGSFPGRALAYAGFVVAYAVKCACGVTAFTGCMFLVNKFSPPDQIGAVNGAGMTIASLSRAVGPIIGGWLWTTAMAWGVPGYQYLTFGIAGLLCFATSVFFKAMPRPPTR